MLKNIEMKIDEIKIAFNYRYVYPRQIKRALRGIDEFIKQHNIQTKGPCIIWSLRSNVFSHLVEGIIANALRLRGYECMVIMCDEFLPLCDNFSIQQMKPSMCRNCVSYNRKFWNAFGLPTRSLQELWTPEDERFLGRETKRIELNQSFLMNYYQEDIPVGKLLYSSILRYFLVGRITDDMDSSVLNDIKETALKTFICAKKILDTYKPHIVFSSHGIYSTWGTITEICNKRNIKLITYAKGYRKGTILLGVGGHWMKDLKNEPISNWRDKKWTSVEKDKIKKYIIARQRGSEDAMFFYQKLEEDKQKILKQLGLESGKKRVGMFTNIVWDAQVLFKDVVFKNIVEWIIKTVDFFKSHSDIQLIVRIHPAETWSLNETREKVADIIAKKFPHLPPHIKIIKPDNPMSSYTLAEFLDLAIVFTSTVGLELALRKIPVIVMGDAHYRGKGFTIDPQTENEYFQLLSDSSAIQPLSDRKLELAEKYAYHYFFRRPIPFKFLENPTGTIVSKIRLRSFTELLPGADSVLDKIVDGIIQGTTISL